MTTIFSRHSQMRKHLANHAQHRLSNFILFIRTPISLLNSITGTICISIRPYKSSFTNGRFSTAILLNHKGL